MKERVYFFWSFLPLLIFPCCKKSLNSTITNAPEHTVKTHQIPAGLLYNNKPIPKECMKELVPILCGAIDSKKIDLDTFVIDQKQNNDEEEQDEYEWHYIGTLPNGDHVVHGYLWPAYAAGKFTEIAIIRRTANTLKAIGWIAGGDRHATMITESCILDGTVLTYQQHMTNGLLYNTLMNQYPELSKYAKNKNTDELYWGESDYLGYGTFKVTITPHGKIENKHLVSFTLAEGQNSDSDSYDEWMQNTPKNSLAMGEALNNTLALSSIKKRKDTFSSTELKKIMEEVSDYAKNHTEDLHAV